MSRFLSFFGVWTLGIGLAVAAARGGDPNDTARMATFRADSGTAFALSVELGANPEAKRSNEIAIVVDTSASQIGLFQEDSLRAARQLIEQLSPTDRVQLYSTDLDVVPMTAGWSAAGDAAAAEGLERLAARTPLGSTDMEGFLRQAPHLFSADGGTNRVLIYIGDGIRRGGTIAPQAFAELSAALVAARVSVSSYAIGPERDIEFLAALANHTGGNCFVDSDDAGAVDRAASGLAGTVRGSVLWPTQVSLPAAVSEVLPTQFPPLRTDRDTIVVGMLQAADPFRLEITGELEGAASTTVWDVTAEPESLDFAFLPRLIERARAQGGSMMPTLGSAGLREMARLIDQSAEQLTALSQQALAQGDLQAASQLVDAALKEDPTSSVAETMKTAIGEGDTLVLGSRQDPPAAAADQEPAAAAAAEQEPVAETNQDFLQTQRERIEAAIDQVRAEVRNTLRVAREQMSEAPEVSVSRLKDMLDIVGRDPLLDAGTRAELQNQLQSALMTAQRRKFEFEEKLAISRQNAARRADADRMYRDMIRTEEQIAALMNRFNALLDEGNYAAAQEIPAQVLAIRPESPGGNAIEEEARIRSFADQIWELRRQRQIGVVDTLFQTELAHIPFSGEPPLVFPDAEEWARKVALRQKYQSVRLSWNPRDEAILSKLDDVTDMDYLETPFSEVIDDLQTKHGINIIIDDSSEVTAETQITLRVTGIRLKSALKILLKKYNATYVVRDEVLKILSSDAAAEELVTYVYNVGDLVAPRQPLSPLGAQGGGGGFGGQQGGGGFGGQQGGGGFGGGGGGLGGGAFSMQDTLELGASKAGVTAAATDELRRAPQALQVTAQANETSGQAWRRYFREQQAEPADVRQTVRELMQAGRVGEVVEVIHGAIAGRQVQPWMYEALVLALRIQQAPPSEIERAVMSTVDFSGRPDDALSVAKFMADNGMEHRAIEVLKDVAAEAPRRPEPYAVGLRAAQRVGDVEGIRWAVLGILGQAWPDHHEVVHDAFNAAKALAIDWQRQGNQAEVDRFNEQMNEALYRDAIIEVSWTGDADIDLYVEEPGGTVCCRQIPRTTGGGILMGDAASQSGEDGPVVEFYILPKGFSGTYRLLLHRVWGSVPGNKVTVTIYRNYRTPEQSGETQQVALRNDGAAVVFDLERGRRTDPIGQQQLARLVEEQEILQRGVLAQQLAEGQSPQALADYLQSKPDAPASGEPLLLSQGNRLRRGTPGYQPVLTTLPEGTSMTARAVTADRLHVIVSPAPFFSFISDVDTFTFFGAQSNQQGGGTGGGGGGFGGGGGGGGGGLF